MVSLLPTIDSRLFHIRGGNRLLAERLINATGASLLLGMRVTAVRKGAQGGFQVHARQVDTSEEVRGPPELSLQRLVVSTTACSATLHMLAGSQACEVQWPARSGEAQEHAECDRIRLPHTAQSTTVYKVSASRAFQVSGGA